MNKTELIALRDALQEAKEGSRELSDDCLRAIKYSFHSIEYNRCNPTRSVDDALDCMVSEGFEGLLYENNHYARASLIDSQALSDAIVVWPTDGAVAINLPLAICTARIKQLIGECDD